MVRLFQFALIGSAFLASLALGRKIVHEKREAPSSFLRTGKPDPSTHVDLRIALKPKNITGLEKALFDVSTPGSTAYGKHLSHDQVRAYLAPHSNSVSAVQKWLLKEGVQDPKIFGAFGDWLRVRVLIPTADKLLNANFERFVHPESGDEVIRTLEYSIPEDFGKHIHLVHPTTSFSSRRSSPKFSFATTPSNLTERANGAPSSCDSLITPSCLQSLYGIPATLATQTSNKLAVAGFANSYANAADLRTFLSNERHDLPDTTTFTLETLDGGQNPQGTDQAGAEADLDIQYTVGLASGVPVTFISVGTQNTDNAQGVLDLVEHLTSQPEPPHVLTVSYGFNELDVPSPIGERLCNALMALGARGVSTLFSSGDGGVGGSGSNNECTNFVPTFPGGCPYVTSVGATRLTEEVGSPASGGGFSNIFSRPSYQNEAVTTYLNALGDTNSGRFNPYGRGFPDVAAQGERVSIIFKNRTGITGGTSAATPIFASVIALINDRLIAAGRPVLGFLNPFLYANPGAFFDITSGNNPGCGTDGFPAKSGWDPVTGLGTPNFNALLAAAGL